MFVRECGVQRNVAKPTNARHDGGCLLGDGVRVPRRCQTRNKRRQPRREVQRELT